MLAKRLHIQGFVQGVGFRPFIFRLASKYSLKGWVDNRTDGVHIHVEGEPESVQLFIDALIPEAPPASMIENIHQEKTGVNNFSSFDIVKSKDITDEITNISPDIAVCPECLQDMKSQSHRLDYPFINCTNCGPRFSIIRDLPYDRGKTTMDPFIMCDVCHKEYTDILDRRFHAQPVACKYCGPQYSLHTEDTVISDPSIVLAQAAQMIDDGKIVAIKGIGGFFIACDATSDETVVRLRKNKIREGKPFAVMFRDIGTVRIFAELNSHEEAIISSWKRPVTLLRKKDGTNIPEQVCMGFDTIGSMLPYMPLHYQLFEKIKTSAIVLTSGNISERPILIDNDAANEELKDIADAVITYNRDIYNRVDDSVVFSVNNSERTIRRSRGYAPAPIQLDFNVEGILATGAELVNCFSIGKGKKAFMSQHIGDLKNLETYDFFMESLERYKGLFRTEPKIIACDMHPDYLSSNYAASSGLEIIKVQHHHAHIASCMAENRIDGKVIGVALDGTGLGTDGNIWGGEFLFAGYEDFERFAHFSYLPIPGGDIATSETWRTGLSILYSVFGTKLFGLNIPFVKNLDKTKADFIISAIDKNINCPLSSSAGRLFDAISAITCICTVSKFHAEAPMRLESVMQKGIPDSYSYSPGKEINFSSTVREIVSDILSGTPTPVISAKFHNTLLDVIIETSVSARDVSGINRIALSGGTFQNRYLLERSENMLREKGFEVFSHHAVPSNDGGIALGQLVIAATILKERGNIC